MNRSHIKGAFHRARGSLKEIVGRAVGSRTLTVIGKIDKFRGRAEKAFGDLKRRIRSAVR